MSQPTVSEQQGKTSSAIETTDPAVKIENDSSTSSGSHQHQPPAIRKDGDKKSINSSEESNEQRSIVGTPSEHSSIVAREPDSTDINPQCTDCRELRREVTLVKNQLTLLYRRCTLLEQLPQARQLLAEQATSNSGASSHRPLSASELMVRANDISLTAGNEAEVDRIWRELVEQSQKHQVGNKASRRQETSSSSTTQTTSTIAGERKRHSNSPAPLSNVSLSNESNSNDDDDLYRSDSGGGSGESAEVLRVAQQLLQPRETDNAQSRDVHNDVDVKPPRKQARTDEPVTATAPPPLTITTPVAPSLSQPPSSQTASNALLQVHAAHHPLISPPHHQPLLDSRTLEQLAPDALRRLKNPGLGPGMISPFSKHLVGHEPIQRPTTSPPQSQQQIQLQQALAALAQRSGENEIDTYRHGLHLPTAPLLGATSSANNTLMQNNNQPMNNWSQLLMWTSSQQQRERERQESTNNILSSLDPSTLQALANLLSQNNSRSSGVQSHHLQSSAFQSHERSHPLLTPTTPTLEPHQTHFGLQQSMLNPRAAQVPSSQPDQDYRVQLAMQQALREQQLKRATVQQSGLPPQPRLARPQPQRASQTRTFQRAAPDDFVREFVESTRNLEPRQDFKIPVPEANAADPGFRAVSEEQILHSVKWHDLELPEAVTRLAKKLAEKRVFGPVLMSRATVAGTNHSNYSNLPMDGIRYIEDVCRRTLCPRDMDRQRFIDVYFRPAMKGLAARCRRIRHSMKPQVEANGAPLLPPSSQDLRPSTSLMLPTTSATAARSIEVGGFNNTMNMLARAHLLNQQRQLDRLNGDSSHSTSGDRTSASTTTDFQSMIASLHAAAASAALNAANSATAVTPPAKQESQIAAAAASAPD